MSAVRVVLAVAALALLVSAAPASAVEDGKGDLVISQFRSAGIAGGDFVELTNVADVSVNLSAGWLLSIFRSDGNSCPALYGSAVTLLPGQRYLITQQGWVGSPAGDATLQGCTDLFDDAATLQLFLGSDAVTNAYLGMDAVTYGAGQYEPEPFAISPVPTDGHSLQRKPAGVPPKAGYQDTNSNSNDFQAVTADPRGLAQTAPAPSATTGAATTVLATTATLRGTANPHGATVTDCHFDYAPTSETGYTGQFPCASTPSGTQAVPVSAPATGLAPSTSYRYRLVLTTADHVVQADPVTFSTTPPNPPPVADTADATPIGSGSATLNGTANPRGGTVSDCHFDYGPSSSGTYSGTIPCSTTPSGADPVPVSAKISGLEPTTQYRFRLVVTSSNPPTSTSADRTFTTAGLVPDDDAVVISQFRNRAPDREPGNVDGAWIPLQDFVELKNITSETVHMSGWSLSHNNCAVVPNAPDLALAPGQSYLIGASLWARNGAPPNADFTMTGGNFRCSELSDTPGRITLNAGVDPVTGASLGSDSVAYGTFSASASIAEPDPIATVPNDGRALRRRNFGRQDTGHNNDDFQIVAAAPETLGSTAPAPTASTDAPTALAATSATLNGSVDPRGGTVSSCRFDFGPSSSPDYTSAIPCSPTPSGTASVPVSAQVSGLTDTTSYRFRIVVQTSGGSSTTPDRPFVTAAPVVPPTGTTGAATKIFSATAILHATVNPHGVPVSDCHFEYGPTSSTGYGSSMPCAATPSGNDPVAVSAPVNDLTRATEYRARIVLTTNDGTLEADPQTFTTTAVVPDDDPVVISRFRTRGAGGDFIDLTNVSDHNVALGAWNVSNLAPDGASACAVTRDTPAVTLAPGQHYLIAQSGWAGPPAADTTISTYVDPEAGSGCVHLLDESGILNLNYSGGSDSVAYGTISSPAADVTEPDAIAFVPGDGQALQRRDSGRQDTAHNNDDFLAGPAAPQNYSGTAPPPSLTSDEATAIGPRRATLNGTVTPQGKTVTDCHFDYGPTSSTGYASTAPCSSTPSGTGSPTVSAVVTGLSATTEYRFRLVMTTNAGGPVQGSERTFTTTALPTTQTNPVDAIGSRTATFNGTVNPRGEQVTECRFDYASDAEFAPAGQYPHSVRCASTPSGSGSISVSAAAAGLAPSTGYHVRLEVTTSPSGTVSGGDVAFTTLQPASAATDPATNVGRATATLNGTAQPRGETVTDCHFEYGTDADFASATKYPRTATCGQTPSGLSSVSVSAGLTGLSPSTGYHARLVVTTTESGALTGGDETFRTTTPASAVTDAAAVRPTGATLRATVNPRGEFVTDCQFEYATDAEFAPDTYPHHVPCASKPSGTDATPVSATLSGLPNESGYHYRVAVTTPDSGTVRGADQAFSTTPPTSAVTDPATSIGITGATLRGTVEPRGETVTACRFQYGTDADFATASPYPNEIACESTPSGSASAPVSAGLTGLTASTGYHYRVLVTTSPSGERVGADRAFSTTPPTSAATDPATDIAATGATLRGTVEPRGETVTACRFQYGTDADFATASPYPNEVACASTPSGSAAAPVSAGLTGLTASTGYHYRVLLTTSPSGERVGADRAFSTTPPTSAATDPATDIAATGATLRGTIEPRGETATACRFQYGTDADFATASPYPNEVACASTPSGSAAAPVSAVLTGLTSSTGYHFRLVTTTTPSGQRVGADRSFSTTAPPPPADTGTGTGTTTGGNDTSAGGNPAGTPADPAGTPVGGSAGTPAGDAPLTPSQLARAAGLGGWKDVSATGRASLGSVICPAVCGRVKITVRQRTGNAPAPGGRHLGSGSSTVGPDRAIDLSFRLNAVARRLLRNGRPLRAWVTVELREANGNVVTVTRRVVLRRPG